MKIKKFLENTEVKPKRIPEEELNSRKFAEFMFQMFNDHPDLFPMTIVNLYAIYKEEGN